MAIENLIPELSWLCTLLFLTVIIMLIVTCVCLKENEKLQEYGTAGRLSITRDSPIINFQPRNGGTLSISSRHSDISFDENNLKRNSWTVKDRALPEIPDNAVVASHHGVTDNGLHTSNITVVNEPLKVKNRNKNAAPKPPSNDPSKVFPVAGTTLLASEGVTVSIAVNDKIKVIGNNSTNSGLKSCILLKDSVPSSSNSMVVLKRVERKENTIEASHDISESTSNVYDIVPESTDDRSSQTSASSNTACLKIENTTINPVPEEGSVNSPSASLAVAGAVPSSDIPYMTPPLLHNPPPSFEIAEENNNEGSGSEIPYTVISVREPLARVREITMRKQRAVVQQNSEENENHYAMVPEEEQMYAEIGSGHDSGSSSITYAHIEPRELPPVPPTVESLKSVAHAHSRQASTVSTCSFASNISNSGEPVSPSTSSNPFSSLYSTVEKNNKQRKTIHLGEGVSLVTNEKWKKVEDLYAKVHKKRTDLTINTSVPHDYSTYQGIHGEDIACITPPPSPWASTTPPAPPPIAGRLQVATLSVLLPENSHHIRRHSADPNLPEVISDKRVFSGSARSSLVVTNTNEEPDYERIYNEENNSGDSCYEKINDENHSKESESKGLYTDPHEINIVLGDSSYPGYESVKDDDDPGYECVAQASHENDPGYEPVRVIGSFDDSDSNSDYTVVRLDNAKDPGYEKIKKLERSESDAADPGYEKIKNVPWTDNTPGYECVKNQNLEFSDPGYETVQKNDSDSDPCYEIVHSNNTPFVNSPSSESHNSANTILYVSGNPDCSININDSSATFL